MHKRIHRSDEGAPDDFADRHPARSSDRLAEKPSLGGCEAAYLEEDDARHLLELLQAEPVKWRAPITFDLLSGLRRAELLGHAQTSTTANIYAHTIASAQSKAMQTFDRFNDLVGQEQTEEQPPEA